MAGGYDNNGNYSRWFSWVADDVAQVGIVSDRHDKEDDEFAKALNVAFLRDGRAPATADWNMAGKVIHNLGTATTPADGDAVNYGLLTGSGAAGTPDFKKSINLIGADLNGRVNFKSLTGVQGLSWSGADLSFLARIRDTNTPAKFRDRLVINQVAAGTGNDNTIFDDAGNINLANSITYNLSYDLTGAWRTIAPGWAGRLSWASGDGSLTLQNLNVPTTVDPYLIANLQTRMVFRTYGGNSILELHKAADGTAGATAEGANAIIGYRGDGAIRWYMQLGTGHAEDSSSDGSHFYITGYKNDGSSFTPFWINRKDGKVYLPNVGSGIAIGGDINSPASSLLLGGVTGVYLRPNGISSTSGQLYVDGNGYTRVGTGIIEHTGTNGSYGTAVYNFVYNSNADNRCYIGGSTGFVGTWNAACDYRIKRNVHALPSMWEGVKKLRPILFNEAAFGDPEKGSPFRDRDDIECGFIAHELQEALGPWAATGEKDGTRTAPNIDGEDETVPDIQGPKMIAIVAALAAALQEAQLRIEALEARLAA